MLFDTINNIYIDEFIISYLKNFNGWFLFLKTDLNANFCYIKIIIAYFMNKNNIMIFVFNDFTNLLYCYSKLY
jgi:hypothetical protein